MGRKCRATVDEFLDLAPAEPLQPNDQAGKTRGIVASSNNQNSFNLYAHCSVQIARDHKGDINKWLNFIKQFDAPPNTNG